MTIEEKPKKTKSTNYVKYLFGGAAGMGATCIVQPLDLIKTRMQISGVDGQAKEYKSTFDAFRKILQREGITGMYKGLGAGLLRQATYTTTRLGVYTAVNDMYRGDDPNRNPNLIVSMAMGMMAGGVGAFVGTPAEVALIRMTADGRLPLAERRQYTGVFNALIRMVRDEGAGTLFRGCVPTVGRAMIVNMAQLASYSQFKLLLHDKYKFNQGISLHFMASMMSGLITTVASLPVDIVKTRIQNMKTLPNGKPEFNGAFDVFGKICRNEGVFALWKGFTPYYCRIGPHTVLTFILLEQMNMFYNKYG